MNIYVALSLMPPAAILAGILIVLMPHRLKTIVAVYLLLIGIMMMFGGGTGLLTGQQGHGSHIESPKGQAS